MLTARGWWVLFLAGCVTVGGVVPAAGLNAAVPLLGLTLVVWFCCEWAVFAYRFRASRNGITVERHLTQGGRAVPTVWAGSACRVRAVVRFGGPARWPFAVLDDRKPQHVPSAEPARAFADLRPGDAVAIEYDLRPDAPGVLRFDGVQVRVADLNGFFYRRLFVRGPVEYLVLPPLAGHEGGLRAVKPFNTLPPPGTHRLRRPGGGSELLDLRDYRPGDPPKTIAWKASARRDRLITKEFESDVPVRCTLFLDTTPGVRVGPPGRTRLQHLAGLAAAVAQAAAANRDLVGLTTFDEERAEVTRPARTRVHVVRLLQKLAEAAGLPPEPADLGVEKLVQLAYPVADDLYPDLFADDLNGRTVGMYWLPLLDAKYGWAVLLLLLSPLLVFKREVAEAVARLAATLGGRGAILGTFLVLVALPAVAALLVWVVYGVRGFFNPRRERTRRRKKLAALFAHLDAAGPGAVEHFLNDDAAMARRVGRFLAEHRVWPPVALYDREGNDRFRCPGKAAVLADALVRAVGRARDNEVFVVLADLAELGDAADPVVRAVRAARARHHQVVVIVPWPEDVPADAGEPEPLPDRLRLGPLVREVLTREYRRKYNHLRSQLVRAGATVLPAGGAEPAAVILDRLDRVRGVGSRR